SYLSVNDYQSDFMSPAERAAWNASFNRSLVGTGVRFEIKGDYPEITEVYVDGPAWKTERIRTGDRLLGIQTDDDGHVDFAGRSGDGVSRMLAGPEGSIVRLQLQHADGQIEVVKVTREQFALSRTTAAVFGGKSGEKIGYIRLPRFYSGNYSSATDVLADLSYLKAEAVSGIILDLRNNKGGSVAEAVHIIGYFLRGGTVMQAVYRDGRHRMLPDDDPLAQYEGKLMVLVNEGSASASELTAATLQQYSRAVIVGRQTFGKGTIQRFFEIIDERTGRKMGDVKLTIGGFYAGEGYATQYRGVMPDIVLSLESPAGITGERKVKNALRIDHLPSYPGQHSPSFVAVLRQKRQDRNLLSADRREVLTLDMKPETSDREKAHWELVLLKDVDLYESFLIINDYLEVAPEIK
ncbi:MAG: hypothetical protein KDD15_20810, partial [Lewinella sp.]|nr:hypothetical protein [Lewinella sp.]